VRLILAVLVGLAIAAIVVLLLFLISSFLPFLLLLPRRQMIVDTIVVFVRNLIDAFESQFLFQKNTCQEKSKITSINGV
jgi:UPF0716 family protein affecting phage T7 exclusion